jgi:hypothetical protein
MIRIAVRTGSEHEDDSIEARGRAESQAHFGRHSGICLADLHCSINEHHFGSFRKSRHNRASEDSIYTVSHIQPCVVTMHQSAIRTIILLFSSIKMLPGNDNSIDCICVGVWNIRWTPQIQLGRILPQSESITNNRQRLVKGKI